MSSSPSARRLAALALAVSCSALESVPVLGALALTTVGALAVPAVAQAQNAVVVNGKAIPKAKLDEFLKALAAQGRATTPELREMVREELIARALFVEEAERKALSRNSDVKQQLDAAREDILIRAVIRNHLKTHPIKDAEIQAEYDTLKAAQSAEKEYKARHILVETEEAAKKIIAELKGGAKFEELAKQSKDPGSAANGGDLDWNAPGTFVKEFGEAMAKLEKGQLTEQAVKTQFGWHVIRVDDIRTAAAPPLEQFKPQIQQELERRKIQQMQKDLRAKAKIE
jgi:peptidyl-prolyl cis-trans isomerase C